MILYIDSSALGRVYLGDQSNGEDVRLLSRDDRQNQAARALGIGPAED